MTAIVSLPITNWEPTCSPDDQDRAIRALEGGAVLLLPELRFELNDAERKLLSPAVAGQGKNVSLDPATGILRGSGAGEAEQRVLQGMTMRFARNTKELLARLLPRYNAGIVQGRTSFRPVEIAGRATSWRKDDTRLHVDSFPSSPTGGRRILRVFNNVNPAGQNRKWRLGESFERVATRYLPSLPGPIPGSAALLELLRITKARRSDYDHFMLRLHDRMKADMAYQAEVAQVAHEFVPGNTWIVYTDQVSHAAMAGQHAFEQTFYLPVQCMREPGLAPQRVLERLLGRELV